MIVIIIIMICILYAKIKHNTCVGIGNRGGVVGRRREKTDVLRARNEVKN